MSASMATPDNADLRDAIRAARAQHRAGGGSVLDILQRGAGGDAAELHVRLRERAGVAVLQPSVELRPDFAQWDAASARQCRCVVLRDASGELFVAAEDPWDEVLMQRVARRVGQQLVPAAAARSAIQASSCHSKPVTSQTTDAVLGRTSAAKP